MHVSVIPAPVNASVSAAEELAFAGVARLGELLQVGDVTHRDLVELFLARIERLDQKLNAFVSVRAEAALREADMAGERLRRARQEPCWVCPWS